MERRRAGGAAAVYGAIVLLAGLGFVPVLPGPPQCTMRVAALQR